MRRINLVGGFCRFSICILVALLFMPVAAAAELPKFQIKKLGTLGEEASVGLDINATGQATGYVGSTPTRFDQFVLFPPALVHPQGVPQGRAFLYSDGSMRKLGTLGGLDSFGRAVNSAGQITGAASSNDFSFPYERGIPHAFRFSDGTMSDLGAFGETSHGVDINSKGQIAGIEITAEGDGQRVSGE